MVETQEKEKTGSLNLLDKMRGVVAPTKPKEAAGEGEDRQPQPPRQDARRRRPDEAERGGGERRGAGGFEGHDAESQGCGRRGNNLLHLLGVGLLGRGGGGRRRRLLGRHWPLAGLLEPGRPRQDRRRGVRVRQRRALRHPSAHRPRPRHHAVGAGERRRQVPEEGWLVAARWRCIPWLLYATVFLASSVRKPVPYQCSKRLFLTFEILQIIKARVDTCFCALRYLK